MFWRISSSCAFICQAIGTGIRKAACKPGLHQRAGSGKQEIRQADGGCEQHQDAQAGLLITLRFPCRIRNDRQQDQRDHDQADVQQRLTFGGQAARGEIGVEISCQQCALEKYQASGPDGRRAAEPRQDLFGDNRLDQKKQEGRNEDGEGI